MGFHDGYHRNMSFDVDGIGIDRRLNLQEETNDQ